MRINLDSLEINAFKAFDINQRVDFPEMGICGILGVNEDSGGSNGSSKSTLVEAIPIAIFGMGASNLTSKELKNRFIDSPCRLKIGLTLIKQSESVKMEIDRVIGGSIKYKFGDGEFKTGKAELIQKEINEILGISEQQFSVLTHKSQGATTPFLLMKDEEKKDLLSSFFDLKDLEVALSNVDSELKIVEVSLAASRDTGIRKETELRINNEMLQTLRAEYSAASAKKDTELHVITQKEEESKSLLKQLLKITTSEESIDLFISSTDEYVLSKKNIDTLSEMFNSKKAILLEEIEKESKNLSLLEKELDELGLGVGILPVLTSNLNEAIFKSGDIGKNLNNMIKLESQLESLTKILESRKRELDNPTQRECSECGQPVTEQHKERVKEQIDQYEKEIAEIKSKLQEKPVLLAENDRLTNLIFSIKEKIAVEKNNDKRPQILSKIDLAKRGIRLHEQDLQQRENSLALSLKAFDKEVAGMKQNILNTKTQVLKELDGFLAEKMKIEAGVDSFKDKISKLETKISGINEDIKNNLNSTLELENSLKVLTNCKKILSKNGFSGYIFEDILEELNNEIANNLNLIPNTRNFSLAFTSDKVAKTTGNISKTISYELKQENIDVTLKSCSGGEQLCLLLATDEALDTVISRRLGVDMGWKVLDEQLYYVDDNSKEAVLSFLEQKGHDKLYLIIDHSSEFNAAFAKKIKVVKTNKIARISNEL